MLTFLSTYSLLVTRFLLVLIALALVIHIKRGILHQPKSNRVLAVLNINDGAQRMPILHYETTIGRSKSCDVVIPLLFISRQHAVLSMNEDGRWRITDTKSSGGILINGKEPTEEYGIRLGDEISLAGVKMVLMPPTSFDEKKVKFEEKHERHPLLNHKWLNHKWAKKALSFFQIKNKKTTDAAALRLLNLFQALACFQLYCSLDQENHLPLFLSFAALLFLPWVCRAIANKIGIKNGSAQTAAFFLTTLGVCTTASSVPGELLKLLASVILGLVVYFSLCMILKNLDRVLKLRRYAGIASLLVLGANLIIGSTINGQRNWIRLGSITVQPSEFVKVLFVFAGSATLAWLLTTRNLTALTVYAVGCIGLLAFMGDFGTALIFFVAFIVLMFMTSGDVRAIVLTCVSAGLGGLMVITRKPYIIDRFSAWGKVWQHIDGTGYQQTRAMMAIASGGLLGLGAGNGFLKNIFAADTDLVFALLCEEWGLLIGAFAVGCYMLFLLGSIRSHHNTRSSYYVIAACAASSIFIFQASLNIFGTVDVLPMTGVTLPFISNGGSSMVATWGLLSFITAALNYTWQKKPRQKRKPLRLQRRR